MNKRFALIFIMLFSGLFLFAQDNTVQKSEQAVNNSKIVITGYVLSKVNVPFVFPEIQGDDGNEYSILCTEKQKRRLLNLQGKHLRFTLVKSDEVSWIVKKYKILK